MVVIRSFILCFVWVFCLNSNAQKSQRIGFIDMEYILENIPEYTKAQSIINSKSSEWQSKIGTQQREIEILKSNLDNERELLTADLIQEREEDIEIKAFELKELQAAYFGIKGDLYFMRTQLVKPIQDLVFNAVQEIAKRRKFDFIFDKSSDLIMLYTNNSFNVSELVLTSIKKFERQENIKEKKKERNKKAKKAEVSEEDAEVQKALDEILEAEKEEFLDKKEAKKSELKKRIEERKAAIQKAREKRLKEIQARRQSRKEEVEASKSESLEAEEALIEN
jgi:Skp family chaperone for outer membrane proteins